MHLLYSVFIIYLWNIVSAAFHYVWDLLLGNRFHDKEVSNAQHILTAVCHVMFVLGLGWVLSG